jgi:hypothetical protein
VDSLMVLFFLAFFAQRPERVYSTLEPAEERPGPAGVRDGLVGLAV